MITSRTGPNPTSRSGLSLLAIPVLLLFSPALRADDPAPSARAARAWSFEFVSGPSLGGPAGDLEAAMRQAGFDDTMSSCWFGCSSTTYPRISDDITDRTSYWGAARRRLGHGPWHVGIGGGTAEFGTVTGYRQRVGDLYAGVFLDAACRVATFAPMAWFEPVQGLRLGAGPAIHRVDLEEGLLGLSGGNVQSRSWKPGFVVEAALTVPVDTPVFFAALVQYRWAGSATAGPWETTTYSGAHAVFPATSVSVSHGFVALGIGGRF